MPESVQPTHPEKLRLLRLRSELEAAEVALANAALEVAVSDVFAISTLNAALEVTRSRLLVVGSLQAFDEADAEVVE